MDSTSASLLKRLRRPGQGDAWTRFVNLYAPLIFHWAQREGLSANDAADLVQEVMTVVVVALPKFEYDPQQRFRGWLRTVTRNKARDFHRQNAARPATGNEHIDQLSVESDADLFSEHEYRCFLVQRAMELMRAEFDPQSWQTCWKYVVEGQPAAAVASEMGISLNMVYLAKSRILARLREELDGMME